MPAGRFAPSPTGRLHLGNLRTALVAWLFARHDGAPFWVRFEDLDTASVRDEHYLTQIDDLASLGLDWDEPTVRQSERLGLYQEALANLLADDIAYPCFCSRREIREAASAPNMPFAGHQYPGTCAKLSSEQRARKQRDRPPAYRVRAAGRTMAFHDDVAGAQQFEVDDFVVQRNDGTPAYHLVVVIDDHHQGVELVVRADDLLESTSRHLVLYELLGFPPPRYAHVPLVLSADGNRLAKRHGAVNLSDRQAKGESAGDVLQLLAVSLGLATSGERCDTATLLQRFNPALLPTEPLILPDDYLAVEIQPDR